MPDAVEERTKVFISYCHVDVDWLVRLKVHLRPLEREGLIEIWDDTKIHAGARWREEISAALNSAAVAVLLISADFIASDFIADNELPTLLAAADKDGVKILNLILSTSLFEQIESLAKYQCVNPPSEPLIRMSKDAQEERLVKLSKEILKAVEGAKKRFAERARAQNQQTSIPIDIDKDKEPVTDPVPSPPPPRVPPRVPPWVWVIVLLVFIAAITAYLVQGLSRRQEAAITPTKFQLTSTDLKGTYKPIANIAFFKYRQDFGSVDGLDESGTRRLIWTSDGVSKNRNAVGRELEELKKSGVTAVVWFLFADGGASPDFDKDGSVSGLDQSFVDDYKTAIELAEKNDISIIWVLIDHHWMKPKEVQKDGAILYGHADVIEDPKKRTTFFEKGLKPLLQLYPSSSSIAGWIIVNEPEVALEQGYVSEKDMSLFITEAADIIKKNTNLQAVSVGHLDLESLIKYHQEYKDIDFYIFHHYKTYMPPSVEQIRRRMGGANSKPIYIGEFSLNEPTKPRPILGTMRDLDLRRFVNWSRALGYAGVWPWALKPLMNEPSKFNDITEISSMIEECRQQPKELDGSERIAWLDHAKRGIETITKEIESWETSLVVHSDQIVINRTEHDKTARLLTEANTRLFSERQTLVEANGKHKTAKKDLEDSRGRIADMVKLKKYDPAALAVESENERKLTIKVRETDQWVKNASVNQKRTEDEITKQEGWLRVYNQRIRLNEYQSKIKKFRIELSPTLYLNYWRDEIRKASSTDTSKQGQQ